MKTIETLDNSPFKHLIMTIGELPASYVESMTYYEMLAWLCSYVQTKVIPAVNNNAEAVKEIQQWIETLDLQDEVDHKLEEMAESGELAAIIAEYLNAKAIMAFSTVAEMKNADNLIAGSLAETYGFTSINDGGGSKYRIRKVTNEDVVDERSIIAITTDERLVAELVYGDKVVPEQFGAIGDGVADDIEALEACRDFCIAKKLIMGGLKKSIYGVSREFLINAGFTLDFSTATIKALQAMQCVVKHHKAGNDPVLNETTENLVIDCNGLADYGFHQSGFGWSTKVDNIRVWNPLQIGIYIRIGQIRLSHAKVEQDNDSIHCIGLRVDSTDSEFWDLVIRNCTTGIQINAAGNSFNECHPVLHRADKNESIGWDIYASTKLVNCVADTFMYSIKINGAYRCISIINFQMECYSVFYNPDTANKAPYFIYFAENQIDWTNQITIVGLNMPVHAVWGEEYPKFTNVSQWNGGDLERNNPTLNINYFDSSIPNEVNPYGATYSLLNNLNSSVTATSFNITRNGNTCFMKSYLMTLPAVQADHTLNVVPSATPIAPASLRPSLNVVTNVITSNGVPCRLRITTAGVVELYPYSAIKSGDTLNLHFAYMK